MSDQHRYSSALAFAQRRSLILVLGLVTKEPTPDSPAELERITPEQAATLAALVEEVGADRAKLLAYAGAASVEEIPAGRYGEIVALLERRRKAGAR